MKVDTSAEAIDSILRDLERGSNNAAFLERVRMTLHSVRSERDMLAYEKGGHTLWRRYTGQ